MSQQPDIVVSIDFGTTFTGVGWKAPRTPIQVIHDWPGSGDQGERKVPTKLIYNADGTLSSWGYLCADDDDLDYQANGGEPAGKTRCEFFKMFVDSENLVAAQDQGVAQAPRTVEEARKHATDYLTQVYYHIKRCIEIQVGLGSVAGGWANMAGIIRDAGFGVEGPKHSAQVDLTEAEAAAVATLKTSALQFDQGSLFLTLDAGGGTTDLSLMRVTSTDANHPQMAQLAAVKGIGIGSTLIDRAFVRLVDQRLNTWPDVTISGLSSTSLVKSHAGLGIENGRMEFSLAEIQELFDVQIDGGWKQTTEQLNWLKDNGISDQVACCMNLLPFLRYSSTNNRFKKFVILSGGLGSSAYVRQSIQQHLVSFPHPNATNAVVVPCQDPQLVVVRGLLLDHQQRMETENLSVLATRVARASYGIVMREAYSPAKHFDEEVIRDRFDPRQRWAVNQVKWMIRKGDLVDPNKPLVNEFEFHLAERDTTRIWTAEVVISPNEPSFLPTSLKQAGVTRLCSVRSNLEGVQQHQLVLKQKRGTCFSKGHKFYICEFEVRVIVAPADLRFELWFGGYKFSGNHEPVGVVWDEAGARVKAE
ncbi:hypothetical protein BBAD15_g5053 [Beauveria bassiana D1-5]|uniref:Hsp70 family chaperone n=1 Tax=Beauveria bassiana D1-5 TaxID=1245745 RepID=A0A0A2VPT7_BEABA|nr:hypothetical protein BBAD15_g5053 [Beauveria bassiana D1-5]